MFPIFLCITTIRICIRKRNVGTRYKTVDMHHYAHKYKTYAEASDTVRRQMERDAVIANVFRKNQTKVGPICFVILIFILPDLIPELCLVKVCLERGIPPDVFHKVLHVRCKTRH